MQDHPTTMHAFSDFNRGMQTRRYIKPTICSRDFLTTMSLDFRPDKEWGYHLAKATGVDVSTIVELSLEFCNIQSTYGIGYARSCQILKLNNNIISRIIGLEDLKSLKILDLSFNSVDRIEGLEKCVELQELLLFHNTISKIEGLLTLKQLVILNLGCNQVREIQEIYALRHLPALRSVSLERNPVCSVLNYREQVIVWVSQVRCVDWKRIMPPARLAASELFRDKYRSFVSKERAEEKRRKAQEIADKESTEANTERLIPVSDKNLFRHLNPSDDKLSIIFRQISDGETSLQSYRQQLIDSGAKMNQKFCGILSAANRISIGFDGRISHLLQNYAACGKILVEGFILGKYKHLEDIKEETETQEKEKLRAYCELIDDVSHDLVKLLMQLELKVENIVRGDNGKLSNRITQDTAWVSKEVHILQQIEEFLPKWVEKSIDPAKRNATFSEADLNRIREENKNQDPSQDVTWLGSLTNSSLKILMDDEKSKKEKLANLGRLFQDRLSAEMATLSNTTENRQEKLYHSRMQEILDFVDQHKAEAYLTRKRALARHGRQDTDEDLDRDSKPEVMQEQTRSPTSPAADTVNCPQQRLKKVEFESDEPLADYIVLKDIKDVVDQISHIPLAERQRMFETRVVEVDDIADVIHVRDELDEQVFVKNLRKLEGSGHESEKLNK